MKVFVTDGDNRAALAVTRSLGRAGHEVIVGERRTPALAQTSRYCAGRVVYPDPAHASEAFVDALAADVARAGADVLIPIADITTFLVTEHRERFGPRCAVPFAGREAIQRAADKVETIATAARLGVPVPRSVVVESPAAVPALGFEFPVVIKPRQSRIRTATGWASSAVSFAGSAEELQRDLAARPRHEFPVLVQERITGPGIGVFACYHEGRAVALFSHRRLRERPPWGGVSVLSESVPLPAAAAEHATRLLDELGWHGVAMVEFKQDLRDGTAKLMEINGRFWGSLQLAVDAGVDFPALLVHGAAGGRFEPQPPYRVGVRNRWLWGDADALLLTLFGARRAPDSAGSRMRAVGDFLKLWGRDLHYENPKLNDLKPWLFETRRWLLEGGSSRAPRRPAADAAPRAVPAAVPAIRPALRTELVPSLADAGLDEPGWNALAAASSTNSVFQTHEWMHSWWAAFGGQYDPLVATATETSGRVVGVAPFVVERGPGRDRVARFLGDGRADYCDVLAAGGDPGIADALLERIFAAENWDVLEFNNLRADSRTVDAVLRACARAGLPVLKENRFQCPTLVIDGRLAEAQAIYNKPSLRRRQNYFERHGRLACRNLTAFAEIEPYLDQFFEQHVTRWHGTDSPSLFLTPGNRGFYRELGRRLAGREWLLFTAIEFDDRPVAFHYGFDYAGCVTWYKPSFDLAFASRSPGLVLVRHLIGYAIDRGRHELDFTLGDEPFKKRFTNSSRTTVRMQVFRDSMRFMLERARRRVVAAVKKASVI